MATSILEKFIILFESNAKDVDEGNKQAEVSTNKLQSSLNSANTAAEHLGRSFLTIARSALEAYGTIFAVSRAFEAINSIFETGDRLARVSESLGVGVEQLSQWSDAAKAAGGSTDGFISSIDNLSTGLSQIDVTGHSRMKPFFDQLHISMEQMGEDGKKHVRPVLDLLPEIAERFEHMSKQESKAFGRKLGFDEGTIMLLQRGKIGLDELLERQKQLGSYTAEDANSMREFNESWIDFTHLLRSTVLPAVTTVVQGLNEVIKAFMGVKEWADHNGPVVGAGLIIISAIIYNTLLPALLAMAAGWIAALAPILLVIAAGAALALVFTSLYDDIENFLDGNKSIIGELIEWWHRLASEIREHVSSAIHAIKDGFAQATDYVVGLWENVRKHVLNTLQSIIDAINVMRHHLGIAAMSDIVVKGARPGLNATGQAVMLGQASLIAARTAPLNAFSSNSLIAGGGGRNVTKSNTVSIGEVNIQTQATDSYEIAGHISNYVNSQLRHATSTYDDGQAY